MLHPYCLKCNSAANPLGIDSDTVLLSWKYRDDTGKKPDIQSAYRIISGSSADMLAHDTGDLWDTGKVCSEESICIEYSGKVPGPGEKCFWKVKVWDSAGKASSWSGPAFWERGLPDSNDWKPAQWIGAHYENTESADLNQGMWIGFTDKRRTAFFKHVFECGKDMVSCRLTACFGESGEVYLNGNRVCSMNTWKKGFRQTDIKPDVLKPGHNCIEVTVYDRKKISVFKLILLIRYSDGTSQTETTGSGWLFSLENSNNEDTEKDYREHASLFEEHMENVSLPLLSDYRSVLLRKEFDLDCEPDKARLYICGLGCCEPFINGQRVGDRVFNPPLTDYDKRILYDVYDVTGLIRADVNSIGISLGSGWYANNSGIIGWTAYGSPKMIVKLVIHTPEGTVTVASDESWKYSEGPSFYDNVFIGEYYNAGLEQPGWLETGFDDTRWKGAESCVPPGGTLQCQLMEPVKKTDTLEPSKPVHSPSGGWVYDMGRNMAGWVRLTLNEPRGTKITVTYAEETDEHGQIDPASTLGGQKLRPPQHDVYICRGGGEETWEPVFTYHGFRYAEIEGCSQKPVHVQGTVVHNDIKHAGAFECSDDTLNRINTMAVWTALCNFHGIPTDCPHREKAGWSGDTHVYCEMAMYSLNMKHFYGKYLEDMETSMGREGIEGIPVNIFPGKRTSGTIKPDWGHIIPELPWNMYLFYGDRRYLERYYPHMTDWLTYLDRSYPDGLVTEGFGDWAPPGGNENAVCPVALSSTAYLYRGLELAAETAAVLGKYDETDRWRTIRNRIKDRFTERFYDPETCSFGSQPADCLALAFGLTPEDCEEEVARSLVRNIENNNFGSECGILSLKHLFHVLSDYGYGETAYRMLTKETMPAWVPMIRRGEATLWEIMPEKENSVANTGSHSHPMQGGFVSWFYSRLGGIRPDPERPGFRNIIFKPVFIAQLDYVTCEHETPYGKAVSAWQRTGGNRIRWKITVPPGCKAVIELEEDMHDRVELLFK